MPRFPIVEYDDLTDPLARAVYDDIIRELGFGIVPNLKGRAGQHLLV